MKNWKEDFILTPEETPGEGSLFVDHEANGRTGHMGHALVEYAPGKILAFYPNCSAEDPRWKGHSGYGWMEYKRSEDGSETWSAPMTEPFSKALFEKATGKTMMCEKAVCTENGKILLFYLTCDMITNGHIWEPYDIPYYAQSTDGGETFTNMREFLHEPGRIYDACYRDGIIYVLFFANAEMPGIAHAKNYEYRLYISVDQGETFQLRSVLPFQSTINCFYGSMAFSPDGSLIVYIYDDKDERNLKYLISRDEGKTWGYGRRAFFEKKIRNPQITFFEGRYFMHGRSGSYGENAGHFVLYSSEDGVSWDEGVYLQLATQGAGAYSNNLHVHLPEGGSKLLIQASHAYHENRTNILHWWLKKREGSEKA